MKNLLGLISSMILAWTLTSMYCIVIIGLLQPNLILFCEGSDGVVVGTRT